ncbi:MAG: anthranilate phosphoribosyltransferase [Acidimicrobiia bacterium]|nr:anthranilate phosphoribosyltransferase [Acidimicrobiia bacterium]
MTAAPFSWPDTLGRITAGEDLDRVTAHAAMSEVMHGRATQAQISAFIVSLRMKGESAEEMTGFVEAMREVAVTVDVGVPVVDTVGTGGDRSGTFNISTTAGLIAAGAGVSVAKHGNRSSSSQCGSADVLEALGVQIDLDPEATATLVREERFGFFFAPLYHPSMRHAGPVRRELGIPTVFNFLGPLANPAGATRQAVGVSDARMAGKMIGVLNNLGSDYAFVFYGEDGLDELTTTGPSFIYRLRNGEITHAEFTPEDFGVPRANPADLLGGDADQNARITRGILEGAPGPARDIALVNAAPAIVIAGFAQGFEEATAVAAQSIDSGAAVGVLDRVIRRSRELKR